MVALLLQRYCLIWTEKFAKTQRQTEDEGKTRQNAENKQTFGLTLCFRKFFRPLIRINFHFKYLTNFST